MTAFKNILFPFDSDMLSDEPFGYALDLATKHESNLIFLYTIRFENSIKKRSAQELRKQLEESSDKKLRDLKNRFDLLKLASFEFQAEIGFLNSRVLLKIQEQPIDLLIIEKGFLAELDHEAHNINCPIMIVPH